MKIAPFSLIAALGLSLPVFGQAPFQPADLKVGKVEVSAPSTPEYQITGGQAKRYKLGKWIEMEISYETKKPVDELTFKYTVEVEGKLLDGEVTYAAIGEGREHYAVMYISPKAIDALTGGKALTAAGINNVWVDVMKSGQKMAQPVSLKGGPIPNKPHLSGLVLNKDETPFAPLYYDRYEAIKKTSR
jgi:hypothetical protein